MQSGFSKDRIGNMTVNKGIRPDILLNEGRKSIFDHKQFQNVHFVSGQTGQPPHPAVVAINKAIHDRTETEERKKCEVYNQN